MSLTASLNLSRTESRPTFHNNIVIHGGSGSSTATVDTEAKIGNNTEKVHVRMPSTSSSSVPEPPPVPKQVPTVIEPTKFRDPEPVKEEDTIKNRVSAFEHRFLEILITIFTNELHLIANIVDLSHDIILYKADLIDLIQRLTEADIVDIQTEPIVKGCLGKVKLYDQVTRILVDGVDFHITKNKEYCFISQYKISLSKCFL